MRKTTLHVRGLRCGSCVKHVRETLALDGVTEVDVRVREGAVVVVAVRGAVGYRRGWRDGLGDPVTERVTYPTCVNRVCA